MLTTEKKKYFKIVENYLQNEFLKLLDNAEKIYGARKKKRLF